MKYCIKIIGCIEFVTYLYLGLSWFLKYSNNEFFEKDLLPQLWLLLTDKYVEKRLLVAEACSWFSPLISVSFCNKK